MIYIKEDTPNKVSGLSSLYLSFKYNPDIVSTIKQLDKYFYDSKLHVWEVPITSLAYLLDSLTYLDDITLELIPEKSATKLFIPNKNYKSKPFKHQLEAVDFGLNVRDSWLLMDEPGAGKSASMIYLAQELHEQKGLEHCLIICGVNTLKTNWKKEISLHSNLSCRIIGQKVSKRGKVTYSSIQERAAELKDHLDAFFYILNVESLRSDDVITAIKTSKNKIDMIIFDEVHRASPSSQQGKNLLKLNKSRYRIGLTGTLLTNSPLSAYLPLKWIGVENANLTTFKSQYCEFGGFGNHEIIGYKNIDLLKDEIEQCSLRRTKDMISDLPPKTIIREIVELDDANQKFYENIKQGIRDERFKVELNAQNILGLTVRLRQATICPSLLTTENIIASKMSRAVMLAEDIIEQGNKVVITSTFKEPVYIIADLLKKYNPLIATGDVPDDEVSKNIDLFQSDPKYKVIAATSAKAGTGITLNAARYMIMLDTPWTYALTEQCEDRIHRVTNTEPVFIYRLISQGTIDELVEETVNKKQALSDFIVDDLSDVKTLDILRNYINEL